MATGLHYFKFEPKEWLTGDIVYESLEVQGLFINICAVYWDRNGQLTIEEIEKRYKQATALDSLKGRFIIVNDGVISIAFLDEQLIDRKHISKVNSTNGKLGGAAKRQGKRTNAKRTLSETKAKSSQLEQELELEQETNIPTEEMFLSHGKILLKDKYQIYDFAIKAKYKSWVDNKWRDGYNKKIKNWKTKLENVIPFLKPMGDATQKTTLDKW